VVPEGRNLRQSCEWRQFATSRCGARFQTDAVMVGIIIAGTGVAMTELLRLIERRFERWQPSVGA
jgi:hypothetical protein